MNAVDMSMTIAPKSDQLNADDLISGPRTIAVTRVTGNEGNAEQPVNVFFEGDGGKPFRPCKSMRRVMVAVWGADASKYAGRSMTLYRDPNVTFGGMKVGGIRISHMSGLDAPKEMALTASRTKRTPYKVSPLADAPKDDPARKWAAGYISNVNAASDAGALEAFASSKATRLAELESKRPELHAECTRALEARRQELAPADSGSGGWDDDWSETTPATDQPADPEAATAIRQMIANAMGKESWEAARDELNRRRADLPDDAAAELDKELATRREELRG